jgi:alpha,alpha-trehalase
MKVKRPVKKILKSILFIISIFLTEPEIYAQFYPSQFYPALFDTVQRAGIFADSKTFPDSYPKTDIEKIRNQYQSQHQRAGFDLKQFVITHFDTAVKVKPLKAAKHATPSEHIEALWPILTRHDTTRPDYATSKIQLPYPYVVPGGRFNEMYYWDSYFTMLGLEESGKSKLIEQMIYNYQFLLENYGFIPNGTRSYFLTRSQPPFYFLMVNLYFRDKFQHDVLHDKLSQNSTLSENFKEELTRLTEALEREYDYWMTGTTSVSSAHPTAHHLVRTEDREFLNRFFDKSPKPRPEAYKEDIELAQNSNRPHELLYHDIRSACESGWDFSSRWLADQQQLKTIQTTYILPVDLNSLLYGMECMIARSHYLLGDKDNFREWKNRAQKRKALIQQYFWDERDGFYFDYHFKNKKHTSSLTLAGVYPLFFKIADSTQAAKVAWLLERKFLKEGGLVTTLTATGEQWDYPNGWAPLQWMAFKGLKNYGYHELADKIARRWLRLNQQVYHKTGKMMEKYNVTDTTLLSGGGEYPTQDGFGWTNGVYLKLLGEMKRKTDTIP